MRAGIIVIVSMVARVGLAEGADPVPVHRETRLFFVLAVVAVGVRKPWVPFWLSLALGAAWELAESTARRHTARLADLAPDLLAAMGCVGMLFLLRSAFDRREASRANQPVEPVVGK